MIDFKQITINVKTEELYKQFNNAINNGHTYLKIEKFPFKKEPFYFKISKDEEENIKIRYATIKESDYFRDNPFESYTALSFEKNKEEKTTSKKSKKIKINPVIKYTANANFYNDLNNCLNIIKFLTKEEYKIAELEEKLKNLESRISQAESEIRLLDEKKSNKFFI